MYLRRTLLPVGLCILLMSLAVPAQKSKRRTVRPTKPPVVAPLNTEELKVLLAKEKVKPLLVNFWATWCDPCRDEFPDLVKIDSEYRPKSLDFVTVSLDDASEFKTGVPTFLAKMKATMPAYWLSANDPEPAINAVDPNWQGSLPATFLYDEKGEIVFRHFGRVDTSQLRAAIEKAVKK
jgi:thiol-disulfide isomerase/thioredoxin